MSPDCGTQESIYLSLLPATVSGWVGPGTLVITAVAWLARKVESFGVRLRAGDVVLPGSCTRAIDARPGDHFVADFTGLGSVRLSFE